MKEMMAEKESVRRSPVRRWDWSSKCDKMLKSMSCGQTAKIVKILSCIIWPWFEREKSSLFWEKYTTGVYDIKYMARIQSLYIIVDRELFHDYYFNESE